MNLIDRYDETLLGNETSALIIIEITRSSYITAYDFDRQERIYMSQPLEYIALGLASIRRPRLARSRLHRLSANKL